MKPILLAASCTVLVVLAACSGDAEPAADAERRDLAGRPSILRSPPSVAPVTTPPVPNPTAPRAGSSATARPSSPPSPSTPAPTTRAVDYRAIGSIDDAADDPDGDGEPYADLRRIEIADGGSTARVTVVVNGRLPTRLTDGETAGFGVDFYKRALQPDSDYQLFVHGTSDGWFAYLHAPGGLVKYPGTFTIAGSRIDLTVPWNAVGNMRSGRFSAFADWSAGPSGSPRFSEDHAPARGQVPYG